MNWKQQHIGVLCGGFSLEREVSFRSGRNVLAALLRQGYQARLIDPFEQPLEQASMDVAFIALHGSFGEDGVVQSILERMAVPYTGSSVSASLLAMNKLASKSLMVRHGVPTPDYQVVSLSEEQSLRLSFPVIIKPISEGSSVDVVLAEDQASYDREISRLLESYPFLLVESFIQGREITVGLLEGEGYVDVLPILELQTDNQFYDYDAKYTPGKTDFLLPADLPESVVLRVRQVALDFYRLLGCSGMARVDMMLDKGLSPYVLECNTVPGLTDLSDLPAQAKAAGLSFDQLIERILWTAS